MKTKQLAFCALFCALGVTVLWIGSFLNTLDLTLAAVAALLVLLAKMEMGTRYALAVYFGTAILSLILSAQKSIGVFYLLFFGCYPVIKAMCERHRKLWELLLKFLFSLLSIAAVLAVLDLLLGAWDPALPGWYRWGTVALAEITFWVYDYALSKLMRFYWFRLRRHFPFFHGR